MLPDKYSNSMKALLQEEYADYIASFNDEAIRSLKINTSKINVPDFLDIFPYDLEKIDWVDDGFYFTNKDVTKHPFYYAGLYYIQEASAMLPAEILPIEENDIVLDACAAPGGKSLKLLNKLNKTGLLISNDISASRANALLRNIERFGFENYYVISKDILELEEKYSNTFDKILLDAPCSGEGMFRKDSSLINSWLKKGPEEYATLQKKLLKACLNMLKDGGQLLYSTCTFSPLEDEEVIEYALQDENVRLVPFKKSEGFKDGENGIGVKLFPHKIKGEGHFVCLLQKGIKKEKNNQEKKTINCNIDFINNNTTKKFYDGSFKKINDNVFYIKDFNTNGIRTLRSGLLLGKQTKYGFEPSQQLALNLKSDEFNNVLNLEIEDIRLEKYLKGETIDVDSKLNGYVLVCVKNYPIGFGKASNGKLKNKIDKGWIKQ